MRRLLLVLSVLTSTSLLAPCTQAQSYVVTLTDARLYEEAAAEAAVITTIPFDSVAELLGCETSWCAVRIGEAQGYVRQQTIAATDRRPEYPTYQSSPPGSQTPPSRQDSGVQQEAADSRVSPSPLPSMGLSYKNPTTGTLFSFFLPGAGHLYAGEAGAGTMLLLLSITAPTVGFLSSDRVDEGGCTLTPTRGETVSCRGAANYGPLVIGIAIASAAWVAGILDAGAAVRRSNERRSSTGVGLHPVTEPNYAGVSLRVSF